MTSAGRLVGRANERRLLGEAIGEAARGASAGLVLVEGEAGIGKTALLAAMVDDAGGRDITVLTARCSALDPRPFGPVLDALGVTEPSDAAGRDTVQDAVAAVQHALGDTRGRASPFQTGPEQRAIVIDRLVRLADAWSEVGPLVLALDDVHDADLGTLAVLGRVARLAADAPVIVVAAHRPVEIGSASGEAFAALAAQATLHLKLPALGGGALRELLTDLAGGPPADDLVSALRGAAGNPFLVGEAVSALIERDALVERADGIGVDLGAAVAPGAEIIVGRMLRLDEEAAELVRMAAILGSSFSIEDLAILLGRSVTSLVASIQRATEARLLEHDDVSSRFRHDLVREAVVASIPPNVRRALHLEAANALTAAGRPPATIATHWLEGAQPGDPLAVGGLRAAADAIVGQAPLDAARLLERAHELLDVTDPVRDVVAIDLVDALSWGGECEQALVRATDLLARPLLPDRRERIHDISARTCMILGRMPEALAHAEALVLPGRESWGPAATGMMRLFSIDLDGALRDADQSLRALDVSPDPWAEVLASIVLGFGDNVRGYFETAIEHMDRAVRAADASPGAGAHGLLPHMFRGLVLANAGRMEEARASVRVGRSLADRLGTVWAAPFYHYVETQLYWTEGRLDDLLAECDAALRAARDHSAWLAAPYGFAAGAAVHIFQGRLSEADAFLTQGEAMLSNGLQYGVEWIVFIRALWHEAMGDRPMALAVLTGTWLLVSGMEAAAVLSLFGPDLVRMAVLEGDRALAQRVLDTMAEGEGGRYALDVSLLRCRGLLTGDVELIEQSRDVHQARGHALEMALDDEAMVIARADRGDGAALGSQLDRCAATCEELGAPYLLERVRRSVGATGATDVRRSRARPTTGWPSLTATEQRVAHAVAQGQRNREIAENLGVSVRTVESHVSRTLTKLGARNRTELALAVPPAPSTASS